MSQKISSSVVRQSGQLDEPDVAQELPGQFCVCPIYYTAQLPRRSSRSMVLGSSQSVYRRN